MAKEYETSCHKNYFNAAIFCDFSSFSPLPQLHLSSRSEQGAATSLQSNPTFIQCSCQRPNCTDDDKDEDDGDGDCDDGDGDGGKVKPGSGSLGGARTRSDRQNYCSKCCKVTKLLLKSCTIKLLKVMLFLPDMLNKLPVTVLFIFRIMFFTLQDFKRPLYFGLKLKGKK